jgi:dipeptidyl aminopeptidase/acylaminoacyl peptidase
MLTNSVAVPSHLWLVAANGGAAHRLTHGTWSVYENVAPFAGSPTDPAWTPDGKAIVFTQAPDAHTAATDRSWIASVDVANGDVLPLSAARQYEYDPIVTGAGVYYLRPHGPGPISVLDVMHVALDGTNETDAMPLFDHDVVSIHANAGGTLVAVSTDHLGARIDTVAPGLSPHPLPLGSLVPSEATIARDGTVAFVASAFTRPPEVYVSRHGGAPVALTHANAALGAHATAVWKPITWTAPDGQPNEGLLIGPAHPRPGATYPLVMWIHGGPEFAMNAGWDEGTDDGFPIGAYLAARGAYVFLPNYRGSDDLGSAHEHAIFADPGAGPFSDLTSGLEAVMKAAPIDPADIAVGGHSYGGYMTTWSIGHDSRWKAAVVADGAVDTVAGYNLSATGNRAWLRDSFGGSPWDPKFAQAYHDGSPITYVDAMKTPTLIVTGMRDDVVPFTESFELYHGLLEHHVPVRLVGIPTARHTPADPVRREAYDRLVTSYLLSHLGLQP